MSKQAQSFWGSKNGKAVHISEVASGLECGCFCPSCKGQLIAKKGKLLEHHFAHAQLVDCSALGESALHLACKDVIAEAREMSLPMVVASNGRCDGGRSYAHQGYDIVTDAKRFEFDAVQLERPLERIIPDVTATVRGRTLYIEVKVTHAVDRAKALIYESLGKSAIEIDASNMPRDASREEIKQRIVDSNENKRWLFNARAADKLKKCERKDTDGKVVNCPLPKQALLDNLPNNGWEEVARKRASRGEARVLSDCLNCPHALCFADGVLYCDATTESTKDYKTFPRCL